MKKKVLIIAESIGGGVRRHLIDLINEIDKEKYKIYLVYGTSRVDSNFKDFLLGIDEEIELFPSDNLVRELSISKDFNAINEVKAIMKQISPDIVHCHSSKAGVIGRICAKNLGIKKVFYTPHAYSFQSPEFSKRKKRLFVTIEKLMSKYATEMTFNVSKGEMQQAIENRLDKADKFSVIYNGIPTANLPSKKSIKESLNLPENSYVIGNISRLDSQKNPLLFLKIAREIIGYNSSVHFVYAGDGPLKNKCEDYIKENNLDLNIHMLGYRNDSEILVNCFDLFLITSQYEGLPYSLIESLRAGVPIIGTNVVGIEEMVNSKVGNTFTYGDAEQAILIIKDILIEQRYNYQEVHQEYLDKYTLRQMVESIEFYYG